MIHLLFSAPYQPVSSLSHLLFGFLAFYFRRQWLIQNSDQPHRLSYIRLYTISVVFLFFASGIYHYLPHSNIIKELFHRLDHMAIFLFFGATVTLAHRIFLPDLWSGRFLQSLWAIVIGGMVFRLALFDIMSKWVGLMSYFFMFSICWVSVFYLLLQFGFFRTWPLMAGTLLFATSSLVERMHWPVLIPGWVAHHEVFHILIGAAVLLQWNFFKGCQLWPSESAIELAGTNALEISKN